MFKSATTQIQFPTNANGNWFEFFSFSHSNVSMSKWYWRTHTIQRCSRISSLISFENRIPNHQYSIVVVGSRYCNIWNTPRILNWIPSTTAYNIRFSVIYFKLYQLWKWCFSTLDLKIVCCEIVFRTYDKSTKADNYRWRVNQFEEWRKKLF